MYNDLIVTLVNITFMLSILPQIIKNYKVKNTVTHSLIYHLITCFGFVLLIIVYHDLRMLFAMFTIGFNLTMRVVFSLQILYYNKEKTTLW